jgi:hypothetical protein
MNFKPTLLSLVVASAILSGCNSTADTSSSSLSKASSTQFTIPHGKIIPVSKAIPHPSEMRVDVTASGRVSTLNSVEVVKVGKNIPYTYSSGRVNNTPGFDWYVSKHFALKSNRPEEQVVLYMELLESSFPHYIELFGMTPPDLENKRMAAVYGSSKSETKIFVTDDNLTRGISAGGEAMFYNLVGYSFPSAREQHQRYIVVHEQGHVFQMSLMDYPGWLPTWFTEGTADALAHHYYDPEKKQLKVMVFDRASPMDYIRRGLREYEELNSPKIEDMTNNPQLYRGVNFLIVHFMLDHPDRSHKFKAYRDEMAAKRQSDYGDGKELSHQLMMEIFGDWDKVEAEFAEFVASIDKTFNAAAGPWEQDGNKLWVRVLNNSYEHGSPRMDVRLKPGEKPFYNQFKFDQPIGEMSSLVSKPVRGVENPTLSLEINYLADHLNRGHAGIGLGLKITEENQKRLQADKKVGTFKQKSYKPDEDELLQIKVVKGNTLVLSAYSVGGKDISYALPVAMIADLKAQTQPKLGLSVTINEDHLFMVLKSENSKYEEKFPISTTVRTKLLNRDMAILAENAEHRLTAFFDEGRDLNPVPIDATTNLEVNPWANPADRSISRLFRAMWRLGDKVPNELTAMYEFMVAATPKDRATQLASLDKHNKASASLVSAIVNSGANKDKINHALKELSGLHFRLEWRQEKPNGEQIVSAVLRNRGASIANARITVTQLGNKALSKDVEVASGDKTIQDLVTTTTTRASKEVIIAKAMVEWEGQLIELTQEQGARVYPWSSMAIVEEAKVEASEVSITSEFRGPHAGTTKGKIMVQAYPSDIYETSYLEEEVSIAPYEIRQFTHKFTLKSGEVTTPSAIDVTFELVIDGEPVLISERSEIK